MQSAFISYRSSNIHFAYGGHGNKVLFCFHGYGEDATSFTFLEKYAGSQFIFYAIDLPFHGQTEWNEGLNFTITDLRHIIAAVLAVKPPVPGNGQPWNDKISLMGFSLGGRVALSTYENMAERTEKLILLAPDGLKVNFWYWLASRTRFGNRFFEFTMKRPGWFFGFLQIMNKLALVNTSVFKFVKYYIGDEKARLQLFQRWTSLRRLKPDLLHIKYSIRQNKTQVRLIYGKHDRIILPVRGEKFIEGVEEYCTLKIIGSGHQVLHEKHGGDIIESLMD